jgi:hypothetical protein
MVNWAFIHGPNKLAAWSGVGRGWSGAFLRPFTISFGLASVLVRILRQPAPPTNQDENTSPMDFLPTKKAEKIGKSAASV